METKRRLSGALQWHESETRVSPTTGFCSTVRGDPSAARYDAYPTLHRSFQASVWPQLHQTGRHFSMTDANSDQRRLIPRAFDPTPEEPRVGGAAELGGMSASLALVT